jgi:hypothetical protein
MDRLFNVQPEEETRWRSPAQERIGLQADRAGNGTCAAAAQISIVNRAIPEPGGRLRVCAGLIVLGQAHRRHVRSG